MGAPARLALYGLILVAVFAAAGLTANAVIDEETVQDWMEEAPEGLEGQGDDMNSAGHDDHGADGSSLGLASAEDGYELTEVAAPSEPGAKGELSLVVTGPDGSPVTDFDFDHEVEMHLIAVRADGQEFRHGHPERDEAGTWSIPWDWDEAGTYRVFADFVPSATGEGLTLSTLVQVAGDYDPAPAREPVTETSVDGFDVAVEGDLIAGEASQLTVSITRGGEPVTALEPYLGAFGHMVVLRDGDLAYLHVHPYGDAPEPGDTSGPEIVFESTVPTEGRYLLFLDFQVDGEVHTAPLVVDTAGGSDTGVGESSISDGQNEHEEVENHDH